MLRKIKALLGFSQPPQAAPGSILRIPAEIVSIPAGYARGRRDIKKIVIPSTVLSIGDEAFAGCINVTEVVFYRGYDPCRIREIGSRAFAGCVRLQKLVLPPSVKHMGQDMCRDCSGMIYAAITKEQEPFLSCFPRHMELRIMDDILMNRLNRVRPASYATPVPPPLNPPPRYGCWTGKDLRKAGYTFFRDNMVYDVANPDADGVVRVRAYAGCCDDVDEDGFGRENYWSTWYLDASLQPLSGVPAFEEQTSTQDFANYHEHQAARALAARLIRTRARP